jgi:hypothetical protein
VSFGGHLPGINYITETVTINGITEELSVARRFLAMEIIPIYQLSKNTSIGIYYLRGFGFQKHAPQNNNFLSLQSSFRNIKLTGKTYLNLNPQIFYLKVDSNDGFYVNATTTLAIKGSPISISSIINKAIDSSIPSKDFDWNISLIYTFDKKFSSLK